MSRNEHISTEEMEQFTQGCCDGSKIKTKSGYQNNRCQKYDDVKMESLTSKFDEFGNKVSESMSRIERSNIAESRFTRGACQRKHIDD